MSEEYPVVDCHKSKDLEFARNLAKQMKEGYGRHNSNLAFREPSRLSYLTTVFGGPFPHGAGECVQARVIGRIGDRTIRERWQDCEVGDAVREQDFDHAPALQTLNTGCQFIDKCIPRTPWGPDDPYGTIQRLSFERVRMRMTPDDGRTWQEETLWKRIS